MKVISVTAAAVVVLVAAWWSPADARLPPRIFCWSPDYEFPVGCDDEEDDDGVRSRTGSARPGQLQRRNATAAVPFSSAE